MAQTGRFRFLVVLALCLAVLSCNKGPAGGSAGPGMAPREPAPVRVAPVTRQSVPVQLTAVGNVEAYSTIQVKAQIAGEITKVHFTEGDTVQPGQLLFTIDPRPYEVALQQAEANLARAQAQVEQAKATRNRDQVQAENARVEYERDVPLLKKGMVSQEEFDQVKATADALRAAVAADEAAVKAADQSILVARAAIDEAKLQLDYCSVRSPILGRTGSLLIHQGNIIRANETSALVTITQIQPVYVSFTIRENALTEVRDQLAKGPLEVVAVLPQDEDTPIVGNLSFIDNAVLKNTGAIRLKALFENKDERLWPGQFVQTKLQLSVSENAVVVPTEAIQMGQSGSYAYVVKSDLTVDLRPVKTGPTWNNLTIILEGLQPEESVITDGHLRTAPGATVRLVTESVPDSAEKDKK